MEAVREKRKKNENKSNSFVKPIDINDENKMENLKNEEPLSKNIHKEQKEFDHKSEYNETSAVSCSDPEPSTSNNGSFDDFLKEKLIDGTALIDEDLSINRDVSEITIKEQISPEQYRIKPFTEEQLTALYTNTELNTLSSFTDQFVEAELKGIAVKQHYLYDLLKNYHRIREQITGNNLELDQFRKEYHTLQNDLWSIYNAEVNGKAECQDKVSVTASHTYHKSIFHRSVFQSIVRILGNIQKLVFENHVLNSYAVEDLRLQIELYIQTVCSNCINITQLQPNAKVALHMSTEPVHLQPHFGELRLSISVLFAFQRKLIRDKKFIKDTREWLSKLVAILLRVANYQDHLFIANQILRCPSGVGNWASGYVQIVLDEIKENESPFANYQINHLTTILALILSPVPKRDLFLREIAQVDETATEALWVIIDSEGEEDEEHAGVSLRENDLVSLLNQLPLDNLFRSILLIKKRNFLDVYDPNSLSDHHVLRFFSFCTSLLRIFYQGLKTYQQPRYNQFCKRLSRLIRHVTQYATDQWEIFKNVNFTKDLAMIEKIQVEYDAFFLRAIYYLYSSQKLGAWQFLAVIPYHLVSLPTLWKIFYFLHSSDMVAAEILNPLDRNDYNKMLWDLELRGQFEEKVNNLSDAESYYLLNTFANMALARADLDMEFIETVILDLLQIGYVNEPTQDSCSKSVKILLSHITSKYPHLLTNVLIKVKDNMSTIKELALYIYEELPLTIWKIKEYDFQLISKLLLNNPITSTESKLARMILSRLNWDIIPHEIHCKTAILAVEAVDREAGYMQWSWQIIFRLKLHLHEKICKNFSDIPELEKFQVLVNGVREQKPLAAFVSIIMTSWGHAVPLVCSKGMAQLLLLQANQKHEAVLFALYVMLPLFINSQECLINSEQFQEVLVNLLKTDRSYISMAKSLISGQNTILEQFGNMIVTQVVNFADYDLDSPKCLIRLWILSFISIPNWNKDFGIIYLLDVLIRTAFFHKDALDAAYNIFTDLAQCTMPQEVSGTISFLFKWGSSTNPSLISSSMASHTYLAYMVIEIEHIERELKTGLWKELLAQLNNQKGKVNVDQALKKACSVHKLPNVSSSSLCIYRWSQQAMDTPIGHPLLPLIWQKFFNLYLARLPGSSFVDKACIGEKFFDGLVNFAHFKKIKKRLQETVEYYDNLDDIEKNNEFYLMLKRIFGAFLLWLEEPRLQESNVLLSSLPPQYESSLLGQILQGINTPWFEFIDYDQMKKIQEDSLKIWKISNFRLKNNVNLPLPSPGKSMESLDPIERILRRISSYDQPTPPPPITQNGSIVSALNFATKEDMFRSLEGPFKCLMQFAHNHVLKISEQKALDCSYQELIPQLYRSVLNKVAKKVSCKGRNQTAHCSGAATIILEMEEAKINERIDHQIQSNRITYESLLTKSLQEPARSLCVASVTLQQAIRVLQQQLNCNPSSSELGVELFYYILSLMSEETLTYPPTKSLFSTCIERLGQSHISNVEIQMPRLLQKILNEPKFGGYLAPHFSPSKVGTAYLLSMYSTIAEEIGQKYDVAFALLSKFDIDTWLKNRGPKLSERSQFIQTVIRALTLLGYDPPVQALGLHDLYKKHLIAVFEHQFPEHYGEVIVLLLKASNANVDANLLAISVWMEILNSLSQPVQLNIKLFLRDQLRQYAQRQKVLQHQVLLETAELLARHFTNERLKYGLYGLYPKCRNYMDVFILYIGMTGHALVISSLNAYQGKLDNELCNKIWPMLRDMFAPWLVPYSMQNLKENMASWIQQLADDRSVLLPWIPADGSFAQKVVDVFFECVQFLILTLPACNNILSNIWQWYVTSFAHPSVKDYILYPIHQTFLSFQWHNFWPSIMDIELMLKVVDQYLPECHMFLGHIFMAIPWNNWLLNFTNAPPELKQRVYQCFFNLLIKLSTEPNVRNRYAENAKTLLVQAENFEWSNLETAVYQYVMDWYVLSCDSSVIFKSDPLNLDYRVLHFLKIVGGWSKNMTSNNTVQMKRLIYIRSFIKLVSVYTSKYKTNLGNKETEIKLIILRLLNKMEEIVENDDELILDLEEVLHVLNIANIDEISFQAVSQWIKKHSGNTNITTALLKNAGKSIKKLDLLARTVETTVTSYFQASGATWKHVTENCNVVLTKRNELEEICIENDCILTLHIVFLQRIHLCNEPAFLAKEALSWVTNININNDTECKIYLIWFGILHLCIQNCHRDVTITAAILNKFAQLLIQIAEDKGSSWGRGLLSAIGITKQGISLNFRFLCRALAGYILAQLPEMKGGSRTIRFSENAPCKVGQSGGNTDCVKLLLSLDFGHSQGTIKECAELALNQIQDPKNSLHNANKFLFLLVRQFNLETYIQDIF